MNDPDYSPEYQDEYQRLWHGAAAERDRLREENARLLHRIETLDSYCEKLDAGIDREREENERLARRLRELEALLERAEQDVGRLSPIVEELREENERHRLIFANLADGHRL